MVKELSASMTTKVIEEDSGTHRYVLERSWNKREKPKWPLLSHCILVRVSLY